MSATRPPKCATVDEYLSYVPAKHRKALEEIRNQIRSLVPEAEEVISYQIPCFKLNGLLVGYGTTKNHCSFYFCSASLHQHFGKELEGFSTTVSAVHFTPEKPIPFPFLKQMVEARLCEMAEAEANRKARASKGKAR